MRQFARWWWAALGGAVVLLAAAAGAFLAWGPVGIGTGPVSVAFVSSTGIVPRSVPSMIIIPVHAGAGAVPVIDAVGITGGSGYPPPPLLAVTGDPDQNCVGIWFPVTGSNGFLQRCARDGTVPLIGHVLPERQATLLAAGGTPPARTIDVVIEVAPPGTSGCWGVGRVAVHYHVGRRRYIAAASEALSGCIADAKLANPGGQPSLVPPASSSSPAVVGP